MKYLRIADFAVQSTLIAITLIAAGFVLFGVTDTVLIIAYAQFFIGCIQMFGSIVSNVFPGPFVTDKRRHLLLSTLFLASLFCYNLIEVPVFIAAFWFFTGSWTLAVYYCFLTYKRMQFTSGGSFLPHSSF